MDGSRILDPDSFPSAAPAVAAPVCTNPAAGQVYKFRSDRVSSPGAAQVLKFLVYSFISGSDVGSLALTAQRALHCMTDGRGLIENKKIRGTNGRRRWRPRRRSLFAYYGTLPSLPSSGSRCDEWNLVPWLVSPTLRGGGHRATHSKITLHAPYRGRQRNASQEIERN